MPKAVQQKKTPAKIKQFVDSVLAEIIDEWYVSVSSFYVTRERKEEEPSRFVNTEEELKRFHDEKGHRIKFTKGDLLCTFGVHLRREGSSLLMGTSVNNKSPDFDYDRFIQKLKSRYDEIRSWQIKGVTALKGVNYSELFITAPDLRKNIKVEKRKGKADVIRLTFSINNSHVGKLIFHRRILGQLIREYCIAPLRAVYAEVFRGH